MSSINYGALAAFVVSVLTIAWGVRVLGQVPPRLLLSGRTDDDLADAAAGVPWWVYLVVAGCVGGGAVLLFVALAMPWTRHALERVMIGHMLIQIPLLAITGVLMVQALPASVTTRIARWNGGGVSGTLLAIVASSWWMVPRALDWAIASPGMEAAKFVTLPLLVGVPLALSWAPLGALGRGFVIANVLPMWAVVGWAYVAAPVRVCNYYLVDQQVVTGVGLLTLSVALGAATGAMAFLSPNAGRNAPGAAT